MSFKVYETPCANCLLSDDSIVSPKRRREVMETCKREQRYFVCHNSSMKETDNEICCRKFYDQLGHQSQSIRIAERLNAVEFVPQTDDQKLPSHNEITSKRKL